MTRLVVLLGGVLPPISPDVHELPGADEVASLLSGLQAWALCGCLIGLLLGAAAWSLSSHFGSGEAAHRGRNGLIASSIGAVIVAAAPTLVRFLFTAGTHVH